jgi:hypothetical protein
VQGLDPTKAMLELARIEREEVRAGRLLPGEKAILELFNRAGGAKRCGDSFQ